MFLYKTLRNILKVEDEYDSVCNAVCFSTDKHNMGEEEMWQTF